VRFDGVRILPSQARQATDREAYYVAQVGPSTEHMHRGCWVEGTIFVDHVNQEAVMACEELLDGIRIDIQESAETSIHDVRQHFEVLEALREPAVRTLVPAMPDDNVRGRDDGGISTK
jgi:hypothetical protein